MILRTNLLKNFLRHAALVLLLAPLSTAVWADPQEDRIVADRAAANAKFAAQKRDCEARFVVASCMEAANKEHQATLIRLRREEVLLGESKRRTAAEAREKELKAKAEVQQGRASGPPPAARIESTRGTPKPHEAVMPKKSGAIGSQRGLLPSAPGKAASGVDRQATERNNTEKFDAKARAVRAHREAVEARNAERSAQGKVAAPLPPAPNPGSSSMPASVPPNASAPLPAARASAP